MYADGAAPVGRFIEDNADCIDDITAFVWSAPVACSPCPVTTRTSRGKANHRMAQERGYMGLIDLRATPAKPLAEVSRYRRVENRVAERSLPMTPMGTFLVPSQLSLPRARCHFARVKLSVNDGRKQRFIDTVAGQYAGGVAKMELSGLWRPLSRI